MGWFTGSVVYLLIWWTVLFTVLPIGAKPMQNPDPRVGWSGVPERPRMLMKVLLTTAIAAVIWFGIYLVVRSDLISFRHGLFAAPQD